MKILIENETKIVGRVFKDSDLLEPYQDCFKSQETFDNETVVTEVYGWANNLKWSIIENIDESIIPSPFFVKMYKYEDGVFSAAQDGWTPPEILQFDSVEEEFEYYSKLENQNA